MKITIPPHTTNREPNLIKQNQIFDLVFDEKHDKPLRYDVDAYKLECVHDAEYIQKVRAGQIPNGFGDRDYRKVFHAEMSCSAMLAASVAAIKGHSGDDTKVAFAPVSGFHHASYDHGGGYCTFNGLVHTHHWLKHQKLVDKVLILDGDGHYGDGTQNIIDKLGLYSSLLSWWIAGDKPEEWSKWQDGLQEILPAVQLVMYQAGADSHIEDPFMAGTLTSAQWVQRDRFIFEACKKAGVPIVWNLAGGYNGAKTLDLHTSTFETAVDVFYPGELSRRKSIPRGSEVLGPSHPASFQGGL